MIVSNPNFLSFLIRDNVMIIRCPRCVCTILLNTEKKKRAAIGIEPTPESSDGYTTLTHGLVMERDPEL